MLRCLAGVARNGVSPSGELIVCSPWSTGRSRGRRRTRGSNGRGEYGLQHEIRHEIHHSVRPEGGSTLERSGPRAQRSEVVQ